MPRDSETARDGPTHLREGPGSHRVVFAATPMSVRAALGDLKQRWRDDCLNDSLCGTAEQVLAEVMNNIVEHAQAERDDGVIDVLMAAHDSELICQIRDDGKPMPDGALPAGKLADMTDVLEDLPEGGFGWFMIRTLTRDLHYDRADGWNCLSFRIPTEPAVG